VCSRRTAESSLSFVSFALIFLFALSVHVHAEEHFSSARDRVDEVLRLADERMSLMPAVAAYKWQKKAPVADPERERAVATRAVELGRTMGLEPDGVQAVFELQVRAARESQLRLHEAWRTHGFDFTAPIPSLERDLRPKLDRFTVDFLRALYLAAPEFERIDFATHIDILHAPGWTDGDKRELLGVLARIHKVPPQLAQIEAAGVLRIGMTGDYAPFSIEQEGMLGGSDVELGELLAKRLGVATVFVRTTWGALVDDLRADRFDLAMGGVSVTPARAAVASFSVPYSSGGKTILSRCEDAQRFSRLAALDERGVRVIVNPGGTNEQYVRANLHRATITVFPDNKTIFDEIRARRADVMITDDVEVELQTHRHPELCRALSGTLTHADKAVLLPKNSDLAAGVNAWLADAIKEGQPARLLQQQVRR
jgi:cyclohexadienyl dehydratase